MNVLLLSQFFSITKGGGEYVFSLIAKKLAENEHRVFVITNRIKDENYPEHKNIKMSFVPPTLQYKGGLPPGFSDNIRYSLNAVSTGLKIIKSKNIDLIHSNNFAPALAGSILSTLTAKPHITTVHDVFSLCGKNYWKKWGKQSNISKINVWLAPFFEKLIIKMRHSCIHTVSEATRDDLLRFGAKKPIHVIYNAVESSKIINETQKPLQFVYVGRLVFYKNLEVAIKAVNIVKSIEPKTKLVLVGSGPHKESLQNLVKKSNLESNIEFKGFASAEEKSKTIAESAALVFPSLCEGFGLVILEAFAQNKPVLVSNVRPLSDIVTHNATGFVLDPHDENIWADHMMKILKDQKHALEMGKQGNELLSTKYSQQTMYQKILNMYDSVKRV